MDEFYQFPDPVVRARKYLVAAGRKAYAEDPDKYDGKTTIVTIADGGGAGMLTRQHTGARLILTVKGPDRGQVAAEAAQTDALLRAWPWREDGIYGVKPHTRPQYNPYEDSRLPAYTWTVDLTMRGTPAGI